MKTTESIDVAYVADLARMQLSEEEAGKFQKQLNDIVDYVRQINEADVSDVPDVPIDPHLPTNVLRSDKLRESFSANETLSNAPKKANDLLIVPKIVE